MNKPLYDSELYEFRYGVKERKLSDYLTCALLISFILLLSLIGWWTSSFGGVVIDGSSMNNTLFDGDKFLMRYVDGKQAKRGDVIVIYVGDYEECQSVKGQYIIKRLIAKEGDKVRCEDGQIEIQYAGKDKWVQLDEPYAYYANYQADYDFAEYTIGKGEIFFLGDNRSGHGSSLDSRYQEGLSHLDCLYKEEDIYGVVPDWAIKYQDIILKIFFKD